MVARFGNEAGPASAYCKARRDFLGVAAMLPAEIEAQGASKAPALKA